MAIHGFWLLFVSAGSASIAIGPVVYFALWKCALDFSDHMRIRITVYVLVGILMIAVFMIILFNLQSIRLLERGIAAKARELASSPTGASWTDSTLVFRGWRISVIDSDVPIFRKRLKLVSEEGDEAVFTRQLPDGEGPMYLYDKRNVKNFVGIDRLPLRFWNLVKSGDAPMDLLSVVRSGSRPGLGEVVVSVIGYLLILSCAIVFSFACTGLVFR